MKVLFYESRPEWGGAQKCELELINGLEGLGVETDFVTSTEGPMLERVSQSGKRIVQIPIHNKVDQIRKDGLQSGLINKFLLSLHMVPHFMKLIQYILRTKPDAIYTSQFRSQLLVGWVGKFLKKKVIWHIHGEENLQNILGKIALGTADKVVVVSEKITEKYENNFPTHKSKFIAIPNGIEVKEQKRHQESAVIHLIMVGALIEGKRQDLSIKACKQLIELGYPIHLHIVGEKPHWHPEEYRNALHQLVEQLQLQSYVTFHGWVEQPYKLLAESDIFLLPSDTEGLPLSIMEAMAVGIPCIATDVGGVSELVEDKETGLLIRKDSLEELVESIKALVEDKEQREKMGQKAALLYEKKYTKSAFLEGVAGVLRTIHT